MKKRRTPTGAGGSGPIGGGRNRKILEQIAAEFKKLAVLFTRLSNEHIPGPRG